MVTILYFLEVSVYICKLCDGKEYRRKGIEKHLSFCHSKSKPKYFSCVTCKKNYKSFKCIRNHLKGVKHLQILQDKTKKVDFST